VALLSACSRLAVSQVQLVPSGRRKRTCRSRAGLFRLVECVCRILQWHHAACLLRGPAWIQGEQYIVTAIT
jgi:hypothetical protein